VLQQLGKTSTACAQPTISWVIQRAYFKTQL